MGLIRLLIIAMVAWLAWCLFTNYQKKIRKSNAEKPRSLAKVKMVQCAQCQVHVPKTDATQAEGRWFCGKQHASQYQVGDE